MDDFLTNVLCPNCNRQFMTDNIWKELTVDHLAFYTKCPGCGEKVLVYECGEVDKDED